MEAASSDDPNWDVGDIADSPLERPKIKHRFKRMDYIFDLVSGNVHRMSYQTGNADQWHHAYTYDGDNRIQNVYTTNTTPMLYESDGMASVMNEVNLSTY